jgi:hypothetical protein
MWQAERRHSLLNRGLHFRVVDQVHHVRRLIGVEGMNGRFARGLARFLRRREVICELASAQAYRRRVGDQDLSELILLNGGGRATADASGELRAAEERAREMRAGFWRRR